MKKVVTLFVLMGMLSFAFSAVNVTFTVNTSTIEGATDSTITMQVRGDTAPLTWDSGSVTLTENSGDYWTGTVTFNVAEGTAINYKYVAIDAITGTDGWEDHADRPLTLTGTDMVLDVDYFSADSPPYTPTDSVDVWFRVNMAGVLDYDGTSPIGVRGSIPLDPTWENAFELTQEETSDYYSGLISFPNADIGDTVQYKFVWGPLSGWDGVHWESPKYDLFNGNRYFEIGGDTTLAFKYFSDQPPVTSIDTFDVNFVLNTSKLDNYTDSTVVGFVTGSYDGWSHYDDTLKIVGDYASITIPILGDPVTGVSFEYKFLYKDATQTDTWESCANREAAVNSDTTLFSYWDNIAPFTPTDSIDVWFRVNMAGVADYDGTSPVGVRGTIPLDPTWENAFELTQEGTSDYYSGLISFPNTDIGDTIEYKFVWGPLSGWNNVHWESPKYDLFNNNRYFYLHQDTTLAFKYFSDEPPTGVEPVTASVIFQVDMSGYIDLGIFSEARKDSMQVRGGFNGWSEKPTNCRMEKQPGTSIYSLIANITDFPGKEIEYKYYIKLSQESIDYWKNQGISEIVGDWGYEVPPTRGGGNRILTFEGDPDNYQILDVEFYNGLPLRGIIPDGQTISVTFNIDMNNAPLFNSATDSVMFNFKDEWQVNALGYRDSTLKYEDPDNDGIYTITIDFFGPTAYSLIYTVGFEGPDNSLEEGGGFAYGRFRCRYIQPLSLNPITWPTQYTCPTDVFTKDPPLTVEEPPLVGVGIEVTDKAIPNEFELKQNYPNPFNPVTQIRFSIPRSDMVYLTIYNMLGQTIAKVTYDNLQVGNYTYTWNGRDINGNSVASGIYFYELRVGNQFRDTKKMILLK